MTSKRDLEDAYERYIDSSSPISSAPQANDAFEVYSLSLILEAARQEGALISFNTVTGINNPVPIIFRSSPGNIYSIHRNYCHAVIDFSNGLTFEAHVGVYAEGLAGTIHECDVMVIESTEGQFCRTNRVHPKKRRTVITVECKFYSSNLGIRFGREFLGMTIDLGSENRFFLSNSDGSSLDRILAHHKRSHYLGLTPLNSDAEDQVISLFRTSFRGIKAKNRR